MLHSDCFFVLLFVLAKITISNLMEFITKPWPWYLSGPLISLIMFSLLLFGKRFGMSSNLKTLCSIGGAGKYSDFFKFNWKSSLWNLIVVFGAIIGGYIAINYLSDDSLMALNPKTIAELKSYGINDAGKALVPELLFGNQAISSIKGITILILGGFLIGFGTRYANGCTSGHAISGLSNLQIPSLIAVIGFFIGGLIMTFLILPYLLS